MWKNCLEIVLKFKKERRSADDELWFGVVDFDTWLVEANCTNQTMDEIEKRLKSS